MTGAGAPGAAGILQCLFQDPDIHVIAADGNPHAVGRYLALLPKKILLKRCWRFAGKTIFMS
jgi:hypothetical protein